MKRKKKDKSIYHVGVQKDAILQNHKENTMPRDITAATKRWNFDTYSWLEAYDQRMRNTKRLRYDDTLSEVARKATVKKGDLVLDIGTGNGVLMIAAAGLGARKVMGIDNNPIAVETARKNLLLNEMAEHRFEVRVGNMLDRVHGRFNLVAANIVPYVISRLLENVQKVLDEEGVFICSGMLQGNAHGITSKMRAEGFEILETQTKDMWVAIAASP